MELIICFVGGAAFGAALLLLGQRTTERKAMETETEAARARREKRREEQERDEEKIRKQIENMLNYTGDEQS